MSTIGIAIPTYNRNNYLVKLLDTIPSNIEVAVSDNGGFVTEEIKNKYSKAKFDSFSEIIPMYNNWNRAIKNLNTDWICLASDDDLFLNDAFTQLFSYIEKFPLAEVIIFGNENIDENGNITSVWMPEKTQEYRSPNGYYPSKYGVQAKMIGIFFKKDLFEKVGGFNEEYRITASDSHLVQKLILEGQTLYVSEVVSQYRIWNNNFTSQTIAKKAWIDEVIYWQDKIAIELKRKGVTNSKISNYRNEVIARNLLGSLTNIRKNKGGIIPVIKFLKQFPYPIHANFRTHLSIIKCLLASLLKG